MASTHLPIAVNYPRGIVENRPDLAAVCAYELVWGAGRLGRVLAQTLYAGSRPVAAAKEGIARYRERARRAKPGQG